MSLPTWTMWWRGLSKSYNLLPLHVYACSSLGKCVPAAEPELFDYLVIFSNLCISWCGLCTSSGLSPLYQDTTMGIEDTNKLIYTTHTLL